MKDSGVYMNKFDGIIKKHGIENLVISKKQLKEGDTILISTYNKIMETKVISLLNNICGYENYIIVDNDSYLDLSNTLVIKVNKEIKEKNRCSCGAKYTSNPNYHLSYCDCFKSNY
ncbi:MAG: hypothetical protein UR43_C0005G0003 [candidate division TM6 bacterium GW2011_GWF2_33_332]|nr:MAG: hypothetical protein UR43_C0005G0003 [candidate division TM6 bacterium GW2011_GWF2_33_332]